MLMVERNSLRLREQQERSVLDVTGTFSYEGAHETRVPGCSHPQRALTPIVAANTLLTYLVPYSVSSFSALWASRRVEIVKGSE
jgi:hypothetical protein